MNNNKHEFGNGNEPIRRYRRKSGLGGLRTGIAIFCVAAVVVGAVIFIMSATGTGLFRTPSDGDTTPVITTDGTDVTTEEGTDDTTGDIDTDGGETSVPDTSVADPGEIAYKLIDKKAEDIKIGDLVLVDKDHEYAFPDTTLYTIYEKCDFNSYVLEGSSAKLKLNVIEQLNLMMADYAAETGFKKVMITGGYRSYETQESYHKSNPNGAAKPGCSDYHTGAAFFMNAFIDGKSYNLSSISSANPGWFKENMGEYGFIFRYPTDKKAITGYSIPWQVRYVGVPHAYYMNASNLCLEQYLEQLSENFRYGGEHLVVDMTSIGGKKYEIFYVEGADEGIIKLPVPENRDYTVSGDNINGFIVTVVAE